MFHLFSFSFFLVSRLLSVWKESRQGPLGWVHSYFFYTLSFSPAMTKVLFLVSVRLLGETHARAHCNYWSTAARGVLCNLCSTSQQQGKWQRTREGDADAAERTQLRLRRRETGFPAKTTHWEPGSSGELSIIINGNCGLQRGREPTRIREYQRHAGRLHIFLCYLLLSRFCGGGDDTFNSVH